MRISVCFFFVFVLIGMFFPFRASHGYNPSFFPVLSAEQVGFSTPRNSMEELASRRILVQVEAEKARDFLGLDVFHQTRASVSPLFDSRRLSRNKLPIFKEPKSLIAYMIELPDSNMRPLVLAKLQSDPRVLRAEPDGVVYATCLDDNAYSGSHFSPYRDEIGAFHVPNDTFVGDMYALQRIHAFEAWNVATDVHGVVYLDTDTGLDFNHPDFVGRVWFNPNEIPNNRIDDDGNGYVDDYRGFDSFHLTETQDIKDKFDDHGHGTATASLMVATGNNGEGIAGINWHGKVFPLKMLDSSGAGTFSNIVPTLEYIARLADDFPDIHFVVNASWGGSTESFLFFAALEQLEARGVPFVCSAGNSGQALPASRTWPARYSARLQNVITVGATDSTDDVAYFSNYDPTGEYIQIAAPGLNVRTAFPTYLKAIGTDAGGGYRHWSGTSFSSPEFAASLGLAYNDPSVRTIADIRLKLKNKAWADALIRFSAHMPCGLLNVAKIVGNNRFVNASPIITALEDSLAVVGEPWQGTVMASDPDKDLLNFAVKFSDSDKVEFFGSSLLRHTFFETGPHSFTVVATDGFSEVTTTGVVMVRDKRANNAPVAGITVSETSIRLKQVIRFELSGSDPDGDQLLSSVLDFGDGVIEYPDLRLVSMAEHSYQKPGDYLVSLMVSDGIKNSIPATVMITVLPNRAPTMTALTVTDRVFAGADIAISFEATDPDGDPLGFEVRYGDGVVDVFDAQLAFPISHSYVAPRSYVVSVKAFDPSGDFSSALEANVLVVDFVKIRGVYSHSLKYQSLFVDLSGSDFFDASRFSVIVRDKRGVVLFQTTLSTERRAGVYDVALPTKGVTIEATSSFGGSTGLIPIEYVK